MASDPTTDDLQAVQKLHESYGRIAEAIGRVIVGQQSTIEQVMVALFAGGHALLVGVPGLAKTLLVHTVADALSLEYRRIQFTPDLMPADITGTEVIHENRSTGEREYRFLRGPVFANIVLADEINRTPPKTQAALLEAMQEHQVTVGGQRYPLPDPFFVLATQNPIEQEGTYPLPEAQLDRFMFMIDVDYPDEDDELEIVKRTTAETLPSIESVLDADTVMSLRTVARKIPIADHVARRALRIARATRPGREEATAQVNQYVQWGAGPRASQYLVLAAKARAALMGRYAAEWQDVQAMALPVLRHRVKLNFHAAAEGLTADVLLRQLLAELS